jgi:hypothetical protein
MFLVDLWLLATKFVASLFCGEESSQILLWLLIQPSSSIALCFASNGLIVVDSISCINAINLPTKLNYSIRHGVAYQSIAFFVVYHKWKDSTNENKALGRSSTKY